MFGPAGSDVGLHLLNGLAAVGLAYLFIIVTVFNLQVGVRVPGCPGALPLTGCSARPRQVAVAPGPGRL